MSMLKGFDVQWFTVQWLGRERMGIELLQVSSQRASITTQATAHPQPLNREP